MGIGPTEVTSGEMAVCCNTQFAHAPQRMGNMETNITLIVKALYRRSIHHKKSRDGFSNRICEEVPNMKLLERIRVGVLNQNLLTVPGVILPPGIAGGNNGRDFFSEKIATEAKCNKTGARNLNRLYILNFYS